MQKSAQAAYARKESADAATRRMSPCAVAIEPGFDFLGGEYRALFAGAACTAFQHPLWLHNFYERLAPSRDAEKLVITGRDPATRELQFVLPFIRRTKWGVTLIEAADLGVSDYAAPAIAHWWRAEAGIVAAIRDLLPAHDLLRIRPVRPEAIGRWQMFLDADAMRQDFSAHAADLSAPYGAWREQALAPSFRKSLDRKKRKFFKSGSAELRLLTDRADIAAAVAAIQRLRAGRFEGDPIQADFVRDFYAEVAAAGSAEGFTRTYALTLDGAALGYVFGLTHAGRFYYLLIGCNYERYGRHSPGLLMYDLMMEDWLASGGDCFDFTIGDEAFKRDFGTKPTPIFALTHAATLRGKLAAAGFELRGRLRRRSAAEQPD